MLPEAAEELVNYLKELEEAGAPRECFPRLFFIGHEVVYGLPPRKGAWTALNGKEYPYCDRQCRWRCRSCRHEWEGEDGKTCPSCGKVAN